MLSGCRAVGLSAGQGAPVATHGAKIANFHGKLAMAPRTIKVVTVAALVAVAAYWYWSPFLAVRQLQSAAEKRDADAFNEHVDYQKLRASIKSQYSDRWADKFGKTADSDNDFARLGAAFGNIIGKAVVSPIVDALVRPETIMRAMQVGHLSITATDKRPADTPPQSAVNPTNQTNVEPRNEHGKVTWAYERQGVNKVIAFATDPKHPDEQNEDKLGLVLQRSGFATWKLSEVRLPAMN
jgi:hypothetical protein